MLIKLFLRHFGIASREPSDFYVFFGHNRCQIYSCWLLSKSFCNSINEKKIEGRAQKNSSLALCRLIERYEFTWNFLKLKHTPNALSMFDKYWDGLLWRIFSSEVCEHHSREKPVQVNWFWCKTHLSSFLCQHKLYIYWIQKRITLITSWCMQLFMVKNDREDMVWNLGRSKIITWLYWEKAA